MLICTNDKISRKLDVVRRNDGVKLITETMKHTCLLEVIHFLRIRRQTERSVFVFVTTDFKTGH